MLVPWVQYNEDVVGESEPNGMVDVTNRPLKFVLSQSGVDSAADFPGFMVGNTGNGSPEGIVTARIGVLYSQQDAAASAHPIWVKATGVGNTGWRKMAGFVADSAVIVGDGNTWGTGAVVVGTAAVVTGAVSTNCIAIGAGATANHATGASGGCIVIGALSSSLAGIILGRSSTSASTTDQIIIGHNSTVGNSYNSTNILIGGGIILGNGSGGTTGFHVLIGCGAGAQLVTTAIAAIAIGLAVVKNSGQIAMGNAANANTGLDGIFIGTSASAFAVGLDGVVVIGRNSGVSHATCICIGDGARSTKANQLVFGGLVTPNNGILEVLIGKGDTHATPGSLTYRQTNSSGVDSAAGNLTFITGLSTGAAVPGKIIFQTGTPTVSGAALQVAATRLTIDSTVITPTVLLTTIATAAAGAGFRLPHGIVPAAPVNGDIWTTTAGLFVRINGVTVGPLT